MKTSYGVGLLFGISFLVAMFLLKDGRDEAATMMAVDAKPRAEINLLQHRLHAAEERARKAERDLASVREKKDLSPIDTTQTHTSRPENALLDRSPFSRRLRTAQKLVQEKRYKEALEEYIGCYKDSAHDPNFSGVRNSFLLAAIAKMAPVYPEANRALQEIRAGLQAKVAGDENAKDTLLDLVSMNRALRLDSENMRLYDKFPADDSRKLMLSSILYDSFVQDRRYTEALQGQPYQSMLISFEEQAREYNTALLTPKIREEHRIKLLLSASKGVEVLAGAGRIAEAEMMIQRIVDFDSSTGTKLLIKDHLKRAGRPDLARW